MRLQSQRQQPSSSQAAAQQHELEPDPILTFSFLMLTPTLLGMHWKSPFTAKVQPHDDLVARSRSPPSMYRLLVSVVNLLTARRVQHGHAAVLALGVLAVEDLVSNLDQ